MQADLTNNLVEAVRWFAIMTPALGALFLALLFLVVLLQLRLPGARVRGLLRRSSPAARYAGAAALGSLTPFCSMTTIPVLAGLLRSGVPFGPTIAFLVSSPLLDGVVLGVLVVLVGLKLTALYAVLAFFASMGIGVLFARLGLEKDVKEVTQAESSARSAEGASTRLAEPPPRSTTTSIFTRIASRTREAWGLAWNAFVPLVPHLVAGTAIGATLRAFLPVGWIVAVAGPDQPLAIPLMAAVGLPIYINAEILLPVTAALVDTGIGTGPVMALVVTGLGMSASEIALLTAFFRPRAIAALAVAFLAIAVSAGALASVLGG